MLHLINMTRPTYLAWACCRFEKALLKAQEIYLVYHIQFSQAIIPIFFFTMAAATKNEQE